MMDDGYYWYLKQIINGEKYEENNISNITAVYGIVRLQ